MKALFLKGKTDFLVKYAFDKYRFLKNLINIFIICLIISGVRVWQEAKKTTATKSVKARTIQMIDPQSGGILKMYNIMKLKMQILVEIRFGQVI